MSILHMSITAGMLIAGSVLFRVLFLHRLPKRIMLVLWEIAIIRLLLPVSIAVPLPDIGIPDLFGGRAEEYDISEWIGREQEAGKGEGTMTSEEPIPTDIGRLLWVIYLIGVGITVSGSLFLYERDSRIFRESLPMAEKERQELICNSAVDAKEQKRLQKVKFRVSDRVMSPVMYGIFRPVIIFPKGMMQRQEYETNFCIRHELVHMKNHDNLKKAVVHIALCIHWFNPLVFLMFFFYNRDMELLCDETVIRKKKESRKDYALTLISMAEQRSVGFSAGSGFGKNAVEERIEAIMKYKKVSVIGIMAAVAAVTASLTVFVTASEKKEEDSWVKVQLGDTVEWIREDYMIEQKDGWVKVQLGDTVGWVREDYFLSGEEVQQ